MKKIITVFGLLFLMVPYLAAKEIYVDESTGDQYMFLGVISYEYDKNVYERRLLNIKDKSIAWIDKSKLEQVDELDSDVFLRKIFENNFYFNAIGSTPNWYADISDGWLKISSPSGAKQDIAIEIEIDKRPNDQVFLMMFKSKDLQTYGVIRMLSGDSTCDINNDGETSFEVFISNKGEVMKGCARLEKSDD